MSAVRQLSASVNRIFNVATHSQKQLQQFKSSSFSLVSSVLSHRILSEQVRLLGSYSLVPRPCLARLSFCFSEESAREVESLVWLSLQISCVAEDSLETVEASIHRYYVIIRRYTCKPL